MAHRWRTPIRLLALVALILPLITSLALPERTVESQAPVSGRNLLVAAGDTATLAELRQASARQLVAHSSFSLWRTGETTAHRLTGQGDVNLALNDFPVLQGTGVAASDPAGNNDGRLVPGEIIDISRGLTNTGTLTATDTTGLVSVIGGLAAMVQPSAGYPTIGLRQAATNTTPYQALISLDQRCPDVLTFQQVTTSAGGITSTNTFNVPVGTLSSTAGYTATDVPKGIPDNNATGVTVPLTITAAPGTVVQDVDIRVTINHTWDQDLILRLVSPAGTVITLSNRRGGGGANFTGTIFDDQAATAIAAGVAPFTGRYRPETPLSALAGQPISGTWRLNVSDVDPSVVGTVAAFGLDFNTYDCGPQTAQIAVLAGTVTSIHTGQPISGAQVSVPVSALSVATTTTRSDGSYRIGVPAGTVTATASEPRFFPSTTAGIVAGIGVTTTVNLALSGFPRFVPAGIATDDVTIGNGNGVPDPGEALLIQLPLRNTGTNTATTTSSFVTLSSGPATIVQPVSLYPTIGLSVTMSNLTPYVADLDPLAQCGDIVTFRQVVTTNFGLTSTQSVPLRIGMLVTDVVTTTSSYDGPPGPIPPSGTSISLVPIAVTAPITQLVADLDVRLTISHTAVSDLRLSLISPAGTIVTLTNPNSSAGVNFIGTIFDDQAATAITAGGAPFTGRFRPVQPLSAVNSQPMSGTWTLRVHDTINLDGGSINAVALDILPMHWACQPVARRPMPGLSLLGPLGTVIGSPDFTLAVTGTGFFNYLSRLYWNGQPLSTSYVSTTTLQGQVPASLVAPTGPTVVGPGPRVPAGPISITVQTFGVVTPSNALIFDLTKANQTITFGPLVTRTAGTAAFVVPATSSSGLPVQFSIQASPPGACTIAGNLVSPVAVGSCTVTASQPGNESYNPAPEVPQPFPIVAVPPAASPTPSGPTPTVGPRRIFLPVSARLDAGW